MREISTVDHLADLVVREVLAEAIDPSIIIGVIERANPFGDHPRGRQIWTDALVRNGVALEQTSGVAS